MVRLLIIGRGAEKWGEDLAPWRGGSLDIDVETLPSAGIRAFSETSPDAVAIAEPGSSPRIEPIAKALLDQPLGQLVPIVTLGTSYRGDEDLEISAAIESSAGARGLVRRLGALLDVEFDTDRRHHETEADRELRVDSSGENGTTHHSTEIPTPQGGSRADDEQFARDAAADRQRADVQSKIERSDYILEPIDGADDGFPDGDAGARRERRPADGAAIDQKLDDVRHEDYFAILEVERSAETERIRSAYRSLKRRFDREQLSDDLVDRYAGALGEIHDALDDACAVLADETLRRAYRSATSAT